LVVEIFEDIKGWIFYSWFESLVNKIYFFMNRRGRRGRRGGRKKREIGLILGGGGFLRL
jgi:hypothetical protein